MLLRSAFRAQRVSFALHKAQPHVHPQLACRAAGSSNTPSKPDIKELAANARIRIADDEVKDYEPKINSIIEWFGELQHVDISSVSPAMHGTQEATPLREDVPVTCLEREDLLAMAPSSERQMFRVPRTATGADADVAEAPASSDSSSTQQGAQQSSTSGKGSEKASDKEAGPSEQQQLDALLVMDFRVGKILSCEKHPEADSLYVEQIDVGEPEPRIIVSGLVKYVPIEQMQDRMVVVVANLKPRNMRKIKSHGMVLAASNAEHTAVEPVMPPSGAAPGERVTFADLQLQPPAVPNAVEKKKLWEYAAPGLRTTPEGVAAWKGKAMMTSAGPVQASSLPDARIA